MSRKWDWAAKRPPTLDEQRAAGPETPRHRSKKDTKRWCRGKVGREHTPGVRLNQYGRHRLARTGVVPCERVTKDSWRYRILTGSRQDTGTVWQCHHEDYCTTCGKTLGFDLLGLRERCPDYAEAM